MDAIDLRVHAEARSRQFHGISLERVLEEISCLREIGDSVISQRSLAYKLNNARSDLDLIVAVPSEIEPPAVPLEHFVEPLRIDVWKLAHSLIEDAFDQAEEALVHGAALHGFLDEVDRETELKLLHQVAFGMVIDGDRLGYRRERNCQAVASRLVVRDHTERMRTSALSAQFALRTNRPAAVLIGARQAVEEALKATVADQRPALSETVNLSAIYESLRRLPENPVEAAGFLSEALATCAELSGVDLRIETLCPSASWHNTDLHIFEMGEERLLLSPCLAAHWVLDEREAKTWRRLMSAAGGEDVQGAMWRLDGCDEEALALCLRLYEDGALDLQWPSEGHEKTLLVGAGWSLQAHRDLRPRRGHRNSTIRVGDRTLQIQVGDF